jgi:ATP-binding cassette subfamily F protein 3
MFVSLENVSKVYNGKTVLDRVALTVENGDRIGLVGVNGSGKTTLLRVVAGVLEPERLPEPDKERVYRSTRATVGFLEQDSGLERGRSVLDEAKSAFKELTGIYGELREYERLMADGEIRNDAAKLAAIQGEYDRKTAYFEANGGYLTDVSISKVLNGLGFPPETREMAVSSLSGGEKTRLALAKLLLKNPSLLILDEPTNHLDFDTVVWLEDYLAGYKGGLLIVSHDRYFLDRLCSSICEIENGKLRRFKGNYSSYTAQKRALTARALKEYGEYTEETRKLREYIDKNIARASTSNMAKSRVKRLEALEANAVPKPVTTRKSAKIKFEYDRAPPRDVLKVDGISVTAGEKTLADGLSFTLRSGEKLGVIGANGTGKSTLLKMLQRLLPCRGGVIEWAKNVKISYFDQENARLDPNDTLMDALHKLRPSMTEFTARSLLGAVRFGGEDAYKRVGAISGGERARLCFAAMMVERGNVLILDEPTNHLDMGLRELIEDALREFDGTVIFVSHDRYLLDSLAEKLIVFTDGRAEYFDGKFGDCLNVRRERLSAVERTAEKKDTDDEKTASRRSKERRAAEAKRRLRVKELEDAIHGAEETMSRLRAELSDPAVCADHLLAAEKYALYEELKEKASRYADEWLLLM